MSLAIIEQETHISFMREDERASIYTSDTTTMTKLDKLVEKSEDWKLEKVTELKGETIGKTYSCPVSFISYRSKRSTREFTEEERKAMGERLHKINSKA